MTGSLSPKVSVCIPVYNGSEYIAESIESVLDQTYEDFHLIVCDNCSTDNTKEIVHSFRDPRIKYVRNDENLGLVGNSNRCLELSNGEYVCIFHHDDVMLPSNLERKVHLLDENPDVGFVHSNLLLIDQKNNIVAKEIWSEDSRHNYIENGFTAIKKYLSHLREGAIIFIGTVVARRKCYEKVGGFNPELPHCNDSDMWMRIMLFYSVACIGTPLVKYRVHPISASSDWGNYTSIAYIKEHYLAATIFFNKYSDLLPQANILKHQVFLSFGERALKLANIAISKGDFYTGKKFIKEAVKCSPRILKKELFWKTAAKTAIGAKGTDLVRTFKRNFYKNVL